MSDYEKHQRAELKKHLAANSYIFYKAEKQWAELFHDVATQEPYVGDDHDIELAKLAARKDVATHCIIDAINVYLENLEREL